MAIYEKWQFGRVDHGKIARCQERTVKGDNFPAGHWELKTFTHSAAVVAYL